MAIKPRLASRDRVWIYHAQSRQKAGVDSSILSLGTTTTSKSSRLLLRPNRLKQQREPLPSSEECASRLERPLLRVVLRQMRLPFEVTGAILHDDFAITDRQLLMRKLRALERIVRPGFRPLSDVSGRRLRRR